MFTCSAKGIVQQALTGASVEYKRVANALIEVRVGLYKIFVYVEAIVHKSTILSCPLPTCIAHPGTILLHDDWTV